MWAKELSLRYRRGGPCALGGTASQGAPLWAVTIPPQGWRSADLAGIEAAGAAWWPLALARQLDDAILHLRTNELEIGTWLLKTRGDAQAVLAADALMLAHQDHWCPARGAWGHALRTSRFDYAAHARLRPGTLPPAMRDAPAQPDDDILCYLEGRTVKYADTVTWGSTKHRVCK